MILKIKNKDEIITRLIEKFHQKSRASTEEAKAVVHGEITSLMWCIGFLSPAERIEEKERTDEEFVRSIDKLTKNSEGGE
tara:strand:- start:251 stop:490 length:240 start_codon:yes stop_codon:yes gene_type:complete